MRDLLSGLPKSPEFLAFWKKYPRKIGRLAAAKAYDKARRIASHDEIMDGVMRYPFSFDPSKQPHATTWLNGGRWMVEADTPPPTVMVDSRDRRPSSVDTMRAIADLNGNRDHGFDIDGDIE